MRKTELQKCLDGEEFNTSDTEIYEIIHKARRLTQKYNTSPSTNRQQRQEILQDLLGKIGSNVNIDTPFYCDYGQHIFVGDNVIINIK